ncbi:MAG: type IV pilus assembly protein PilM [Candidatus Marinimicrobia bacterium]|nr:type IV pilus assembly protein PilM [Candidatus Neomarinimicrobiota bacterium]
MYLGLDIGRQVVKLVALEKIKSGFKVMKTAQRLIPEQSRPFDPEKIDSPMRVIAIKELLRQNGIKPKRVKNLITGISGTNSSVKQITTMEMATSELESSMSFEARKHIPMDGTDAVIDYQILGPNRSEVDKIDVALIACTKRVLSNHLDMVKDSGMKPGIVDVDPVAVMNAFLATHNLPEEGVVVLLDIGAVTSSLIVWGNQDMFFTRDLPIGIHEMVKDISTRKSIDYLTAQTELLNSGVEAFKKTEEEKSIIAVTDRSSLENFIEDVRRTLRFYAKSSNQSHFTGIYLSGGGSSISGLSELIQDRLQMDTEVFNPFSGMEMKDDLIEGNPSQYTIASGLAIRGCKES